MTSTFEGFVHRRTKVKGYEFPFGTRYEFSALIFDLKMVGHKFNFPADFNQKVHVGHRIRIRMENPIKNKDFIIIRDEDEVDDLGVALVTDPAIEYKFFGGYITIPWKGLVNIHNPRMVGCDGIKIVRIPTDLVEREDAMCSDFHVKGIRVLGKIKVTEILSIVPKTTTKTWEERISRIWFTEKGMTMRRMGKSIFIPAEILPFPTTDKINDHKSKILGSIKVTMLYRLKARWNNERQDEDRRWIPVAPEKVEFTDPVSISQIVRYIGDSYLSM